MKNLKGQGRKLLSILLVLCLVLAFVPVTAFADSGDVEINEANFPDANFRSFVSEKADKNNDGVLSAAEIANVKFLNCAYDKIESLQGIEFFTALEVLYCYGNKLTTLDVSKNTALEFLYCGANELTALDISKNTKLIDLECGDNRLTSLDVTGLSDLFYFECDDHTYSISVGTDRSFDLTTLPGSFDVSRASDWTGGSVSGNTLTVNEGADTVTYKYNCGQGKSANFSLTVTLSDTPGDDDVIRNIEITGATLSYNIGDTPVATAVKGDENASNYKIRYEQWYECEERNGTLQETYGYWFSDAQYYPPIGGPFTSFKQGKTYFYCIELEATNGRTFPSDASLSVNGIDVNSENIQISENGTVLRAVDVVAVNPTQRDQNQKIISIEATVTEPEIGATPADTADVVTNPENGASFDRIVWFKIAKEDFTGTNDDIWDEMAEDETFQPGYYFTPELYFSTKEGFRFAETVTGKVNGRDHDDTYGDIYQDYDYAYLNIVFAPLHVHEAGDEYEYDENNHWNTCTECGEKMNVGEHAFSWVIDKEATANEKGSKHEECTVCGYKKAAVEIPATGSSTGTTDPTNPTTSTNPSIPTGSTPDTGATSPQIGDNNSGNSNVGSTTQNTGATGPKTGDNSNIVLWLAVLLASCGGVIGSTVYIRRRRLKNDGKR